MWGGRCIGRVSGAGFEFVGVRVMGTLGIYGEYYISPYIPRFKKGVGICVHSYGRAVDGLWGS